jgi:hypothetical protein
MPEYYDEEGQELFTSMEGAPLREPEIIAKQLILQLDNFPIYLLAAANTMVGEIVSNAFDVIAPPARVSVFWIHELQRIEAVLQNMLSNNQSAISHNLVVAMKSPIKNFDDFATFRQTISIAYSLWERANGMQYAQQTADWTSKMVESHLVQPSLSLSPQPRHFSTQPPLTCLIRPADAWLGIVPSQSSAAG